MCRIRALKLHINIRKKIFSSLNLVFMFFTRLQEQMICLTTRSHICMLNLLLITQCEFLDPFVVINTNVTYRYRLKIDRTINDLTIGTIGGFIQNQRRPSVQGYGRANDCSRQNPCDALSTALTHFTSSYSFYYTTLGIEVLESLSLYSTVRED